MSIVGLLILIVLVLLAIWLFRSFVGGRRRI